MATIYASNSGYIFKSATSGAWTDARDASSGTAADNPTGGDSSNGVRGFHTSGRGGNSYNVYRSFFYFDVSSITTTVDSVTLKVYGKTNGTADVIAVLSTAFGGNGGTALVDDDFNNFTTGGSGDLSSEITTWSTSGYNSITLNILAKSLMLVGDHLIICLMEYDHDHQDVAPSSETLAAGMYYDNETGTSKDPYIEYELVTGYANDVMGVASANIGKVNGVVTASIEKVIGV